LADRSLSPADVRGFVRAYGVAASAAGGLEVELPIDLELKEDAPDDV